MARCIDGQLTERILAKTLGLEVPYTLRGGKSKTISAIQHRQSLRMNQPTSPKNCGVNTWYRPVSLQHWRLSITKPFMGIDDDAWSDQYLPINHMPDFSRNGGEERAFCLKFRLRGMFAIMDDDSTLLKWIYYR